MANNRMFLVHRPTGVAVELGRRMGYGWHTNDHESLGNRIKDLYETLVCVYNYAGNQDDFAIVMEDATYAPMATDNWNYSDKNLPDGLIQIEFNDSENIQNNVEKGNE